MRAGIVGAGPSGLAAAKKLKEHGFDVDVYESSSDVGGIWNTDNSKSPVYRSAHLISSKSLCEFREFPMPKHYPDYPGHRLVSDYLRGYAEHFDLYPHIHLNQRVDWIERSENLWRFRIADAPEKSYDILVLATGFEWYPVQPKHPGHFDGTILHSSEYRTPQIFEGKRVVIVGVGNSGADIAVEASGAASATFLSQRRGYYFVPKYFMGKPSDAFNEISAKLRIPFSIRRAFSTLLLNTFIGKPERFGLPKPNHKLFESHPIINSHLYQALGQGDIFPKPDVKRLDGKEVVFADGSREKIDLILYATGYQPQFPYIDKRHLNWKDDHPHLYLHCFHPEYDNFALLGHIKPASGVFWLCEAQATLAVEWWKALESQKGKLESFRKLKAGPQPDLGNGIRYVSSPRHFYEVDHRAYYRTLEKLRRLFR